MSRVEFICAGPGDPALLTLKAAEALAEAAFVLAPGTFQRSFGALLVGKEISSPFQMDHSTLVAWIEERLPRGTVAFLVPGDLAFFCPFQSFVAHFGERCRVIPGVGSQAVAASVLKRTFDIPGVAHATIVTSPRAFARDGGRVGIREYARLGHTLVIFMNDLPLSELVAELHAGFGKDVPFALLENLSCPDEVVTIGSLDTICNLVGARDPFGIETASPEPTLALAIVGEALGRNEDPSWWDRRYEKLWKPRGLQ